MATTQLLALVDRIRNTELELDEPTFVENLTEGSHDAAIVRATKPGAA